MSPEAVKVFCRAGALVVFATGVFGSLLCLPYALGTYLPEIAVAGTYFIAGAIMIVGGLFTYVYLISQK